MRLPIALAVLNVTAWGLLLAILPRSHFASPGAYLYWWFDDLPWIIFLGSMFICCLLMIPQLCGSRELKRIITAVAACALFAVLPYIAFSGGGV